MTQRLDQALAARGLARSRTQAQALIAQGVVTVDGLPAHKPSTPVDEGTTLAVAVADHYVSRAAHKLIAGLDAFGVTVDGRVALDMGASTGGFTQVLRERGAHPVIAVDVGHDQLVPEIGADPGVIAIEGFNVRYMTRDALAGAAGTAERPQVVTGDLSFISLRHVLPAVGDVATDDADIVLLIKPQFEVGRTAVKGGLVSDPTARADAVSQVLWAAWDVGLTAHGLISSPILGTHGNREYVVHLRPGSGADPSEWRNTVDELTGGS